MKASSEAVSAVHDGRYHLTQQSALTFLTARKQRAKWRAGNAGGGAILLASGIVTAWRKPLTGFPAR